MKKRKMNLETLLSGTGYSCHSPAATPAAMTEERPLKVVYDSRLADADSLFVAMEGFLADGHNYCRKAYESGCRYFLVNHAVDLPAAALVFEVQDSRAALPIIAANFFAHPAERLTLVGITGTKGKTTTCRALAKMLNDAGVPTASIGTGGAYFGDLHIETGLTTPESLELQGCLRTFADAGARCVVMEVSSTGLKFHRVDGLVFDYGIFTNFGADHVGRLEHPSLEDYRDSKALFFPMCRTVYINRDDALADYFASFARGEVIFYSCSNWDGADILAQNIASQRLDNGRFRTGMEVLLPSPLSSPYALSFPLIGRFNAENILPAVAVALKLGADLPTIRRSLSTLYIPGRTEIVDAYPGVLILVDLAHNGLSVGRLLAEVKPYVAPGGRLMTLISTISYRTDVRRQGMAEAAAKWADLIMLSTSWVGHEDPNEIIADMASYLSDFRGEVLKEPDRRKAVEQLVNLAEPGDVIVLCEMGNDNYLIIGDDKIPYTDREAVECAARRRLERESHG